MIAIVQLRITDDVGNPLVVAERSELSVQLDGDPEGNLLKGGALLDRLARDALDAAHEQVSAYRKDPAAGVVPPRTEHRRRG